MTWQDTEVEIARIYALWLAFPVMPSKVKQPKEWAAWDAAMEEQVRVPSRAVGAIRWQLLMIRNVGQGA